MLGPDAQTRGEDRNRNANAKTATEPKPLRRMSASESYESRTFVVKPSSGAVIYRTIIYMSIVLISHFYAGFTTKGVGLHLGVALRQSFHYLLILLSK